MEEYALVGASPGFAILRTLEETLAFDPYGKPQESYVLPS
jgi:hypothetical protein